MIFLYSLAAVIFLVWWMRDPPQPDALLHVAVGCRSMFHPHGDESHVIIGVYSTHPRAEKEARRWLACHPVGEVVVLNGKPGADLQKAKWFRCCA